MAQINKSTDYFNTVLYTGDDSSNRGITGVGFQPDLVWNKTRNQLNFNHYIFDSVRGAGEIISSNLTNAETDYTSEFLSLDSDGFSVTQNAGSLGINWSNGNYVNWCWLGANGTASNTDGSITSTVSANTTSGFSIVSYTGNGTGGATVGHGLGTTPAMIFVKNRSSTNDWNGLHKSLTGTNGIFLNLNAATSASSTFWNNTNPSSSVFTIGNHVTVNTNTNNYIAYCFAEKKGFSKFGSYTGNNNNDGTFVYTGFSPAFIIVKRTDGADHWTMYDNKRTPYNVNPNRLFPSTNGSESTADASYNVDLLSNGFKWRGTSTGTNTSGSYIYMAFAESPLVGTNNTPATAR